MSWVVETLSGFEDRAAISSQGCSYSYSELATQIEKFNECLGKQVPSGSVVAILSDYSFLAIAVFFALQKNRNIIVPITTKVDYEVEERLQEAFVDYALTIEEGDISVAPRTPASAEGHPIYQRLQTEEHAGLVLFSSGSTGKPKAMVHNLDNLLETFRNKKSKKLNILVFLMFDHIGGLNTLLNTLSMGATVVLPETRDPNEICGLIEKYRIHLLPASPTFLNLMLMSGGPGRFDLSSLKMISYGTEAMPTGLLTRLRETFPRVRFLQTFGTSETGITSTSSKSSASTLLKIEDPNIEYKIVADELWLRSKTQILGYLNASMERFTEDGWFKTGDLVDQEEDGYLRIIGRSQEVINVGGEKVLPIEVESVLLEMPQILDCTVYAEASSITGQQVVANVVLQPGELPMAIKKMVRKFCRGKLDRYKIPVRINVCQSVEATTRFKKSRKIQG